MIYFIQSGDRALVKIGYCKGDPRMRMGGLQVGSADHLKLLGFIPGDQIDERAWHRCFDIQRVRGEWFQLTEGLEAVIREQVAIREKAAAELEDPCGPSPDRVKAHLERMANPKLRR